MRGALPVGRRLLAGLRGDRRTLALVVGAPVFIVFLFSEVLSAPERVAHVLLGLFVFILTYLLTAIGFLRERTAGTLERVLAAPVSRTGLVLGYVLGFGALAACRRSCWSARSRSSSRSRSNTTWRSWSWSHYWAR